MANSLFLRIYPNLASAILVFIMFVHCFIVLDLTNEHRTNTACWRFFSPSMDPRTNGKKPGVFVDVLFAKCLFVYANSRHWVFVSMLANVEEGAE